ncbi:hypothetical protein GLAREA_01803 [Glarea lozoyensis ATCC 20868]|uniref:Uncharacterized protein n=1 Tax=Glarea lozoyensis (strain ATCC 20868 / MF5171) TaxID=1116229 RepID=S3D1J0_GLAL2|nr:uncharacterized protein GLAREA_01803 [Glarea lozoyensis ATCC 20868]EPE25891.1 hypothetical protein GLAREA_01803 [Glarea lozoyensis ATCC 20868]
MRAGRDNRLSQELKSPPTSYTNNSGLSRRLSKRQENPPAIRTVQQQQQQTSPLEDRSLHSARQSRSQLPSPQESSEHSSDIDPFQIQESDQAHPQHSPQEIGQHQTIRAVLNEQDPAVFTQSEDDHSQFAPAPPPHSPHVSYHHHPESGAQGQYELQNQTPPQQSYNLQPGFNFSNDPYRQPNPETVSQLSHDSPIEQVQEQQRPASVQSNGQSPTSFNNRSQYPDRTTSIQGSLQAPRPLSQVAGPMGPPAGSSQQNRRSNTDSKSLQGMNPGQPESREGGSNPPGYSRGSTFPGNQPPPPGLSPLPSAVGTQGQGPNYRGGPPQRDQYGNTGGGEQGRSTPPPQPPGQDVAEAYKELQIKYKKVKGLYFDKTAQVEQLQNTLANQRLSQSRTSLDDSEYMTRFQRLDGATTNLAFNIRKDWRSVPSWLAQSVNQDALKIGKQEMTAVGRACIAKFLVEQIFSKTFHPGLETGLSSSLKTVEQNIRRFSPILNNQEESDALTAKVVQWRLATLEGLRDVLNSPESEEHRRDFSRAATTNLTAELINYLQDPMPPGIEDSAHMIVELAVSIASNLPLESRDIAIIYPMPGDQLQPFIMKVETGIPPLENPGADCDEIDGSSTGSGDKDDVQKENEKSNKLHKDKPAKPAGMLQTIMGGSNTTGKKTSANPQAGMEGQGPGDAKSKSSDDGSQRVRFAGFIGVEVKGRQVLGKAPVWTLG